MPRHIGEALPDSSRPDRPLLPKSVRGNSIFRLQQCRDAWEAVPTYDEDTGLVAEVEWLPRLTRLPIIPGVSGVEQPRKGFAPNPEPALVKAARRGSTVLNDQDADIRELCGGRSYISRHLNERKQWVYLDMWTIVDTSGQNVRYDCDEVGLDEFRRGLIERKKVPALNPMACRDELEKWEKRRDRLRELVGKKATPGAKRSLEEAEAWVLAIVAAMPQEAERQTTQRRSRKRATKRKTAKGKAVA
jgi:hypothetical protein